MAPALSSAGPGPPPRSARLTLHVTPGLRRQRPPRRSRASARAAPLRRNSPPTCQLALPVSRSYPACCLLSEARRSEGPASQVDEAPAHRELTSHEKNRSPPLPPQATSYQFPEHSSLSKLCEFIVCLVPQKANTIRQAQETREQVGVGEGPTTALIPRLTVSRQSYGHTPSLAKAAPEPQRNASNGQRRQKRIREVAYM